MTNLTPYYEDDLTVLYHADCLQHLDILDQADVMVTDPPYGVDHRPGRMSNFDSDRSTIAGDLTTDARDTVLNRWGGEPAIVFGSWRQPRPEGTRHRLIWHKTKAAPGFRTLPWYPAEEEIYILGEGFIGHPTQNVLTTTTMQAGANGLVAKIGHPTPKPVELMEELISRCPPEWVIIDPFAGSGSTLRAAKNLGRRAIGFEIEERYCEIAAQRLAQEVLFA